MPAPDPFATRLSLFTGKGGVGKTTVVAALALEAARRGRRPLIVELGHRASIQSVFGVPTIGHTPTEVRPGVSATNFDLDAALQDYIADHIPIPALARRISRSPSLARFFEAAPAVAEVLTLQRLEQFLADRWDPILVDLDATGHALMFLELPRVFEGLVSDGPIRQLLDGFSSLLSDSDRTALHLVTLPGRLPVQETLELHQRLAHDHAIRLGVLFANRIPTPPAVDPLEVEAWLKRLAPDHRDRMAVERLASTLRQSREAERQVERLATEIPMPLCRLPDQRADLDLRALGRIAGGAP